MRITEIMKFVDLVLKAVALAMGVDVVVLSFMGRVETISAISMLGIGLVCLEGSSYNIGRILANQIVKMEFGNGMEIRSDGRLSQYIGAYGSTGTYTMKGDVANVSFSSDMDGSSYNSELEVQVEDTNTSLVMDYEDFTFIWI